jgi:hypothetical protein
MFCASVSLWRLIGVLLIYSVLDVGETPTSAMSGFSISKFLPMLETKIPKFKVPAFPFSTHPHQAHTLPYHGAGCCGPARIQ